MEDKVAEEEKVGDVEGQNGKESLQAVKVNREKERWGGQKMKE